MRQLFTRYPNKSRRFFEILVPGASWLLITMPLWLSFSHPAMVAYLIITFDVYWFYKSFTLAIHAIRSFLILQAHVKIDWLSQARAIPQFNNLYHAVIIPQYREPIHILRRTLENLAKQDFPRKRLIVVLACEDKDPHARETGTLLKREFGPSFGHFLVTRHMLHLGEVAGKSSNMAWAAKHLVAALKSWHIPVSQVTVTSCDADALPHPKYFSALTYQFLTDPDRRFHFYQGAILFYSNIWRIPLPTRVLNTLGSIWNLALLSQQSRFINFSTYSLPLETAASVGYWDVDVIPEDYHLFFKVYFALGEKVTTRGIFLPVLVDAAESRTFLGSLVNQYEQSKRWAWGVSDIPYVIRGVFLNSHIALHDRVRRLLFLMEHHVFWPSNWFILTLGSAIPPILNPAFGRTVLGHNLSQISSGILTLSAIFLLVVVVIDLQAKPPRPKEFASWKLPFLYLQWLTLPIVSFFLAALPGLDAHTRLMLGKRLEYRVTEKV
ncbi:glycosyltransferase family 2 protein [Candidatus Gottesmanbacteria bacterium]|nr:glycosyltransferase family 2 protein [Candidatus Gottesmanbacteria bacterium]